MTLLPNAEDRDKYWSQDRNGYEYMLKSDMNYLVDMVNKGSGDVAWFETCGPTSIINVLDAKGVNVFSEINGVVVDVRPADLITSFMNTYTQVRIDAYKTIDKTFKWTYPANENSQLFPYAIKSLFGVDAEWHDCKKEVRNTFDVIRDAILAGRGVVCSLISPHHFNAIVGYDEKADTLIRRDPWIAGSAEDGFWLPTTRAYTKANINDIIVII